MLTVATYPYLNALWALRNVNNAQHIQLPRGGLALVNPKFPRSIYLAYAGLNYQVQAYGASATRLLQLARGGDVREVR